MFLERAHNTCNMIVSEALHFSEVVFHVRVAFLILG
jgi:hypothetical protein